MSKIFRALKKAQGELADIASPLIDFVEEGRKETGEQKPSSRLRQLTAEQGQAVQIDRGSAEKDAVLDLGRVRVEQVEITPESRIVLLTDPRSPGADRFRYLRLRLREFKGLAKLQTLVVTSALPRDGKSTVAMNLATVLAEEGQRKVLLIEADLYNPTLAKSLGIGSEPGLAECLEDSLDPVSALQLVEPLGWYLLQAGKTKKNPTEVLQLDSLPALMQTLSRHFEWILIDTPPVGPLSDALILSRQADGSLLVVRADQTPQEAVKEAVSLLGAKRVLGIVLNAAEGVNRLYSDYSGYYAKK